MVHVENYKAKRNPFFALSQSTRQLHLPLSREDRDGYDSDLQECRAKSVARPAIGRQARKTTQPFSCFSRHNDFHNENAIRRLRLRINMTKQISKARIYYA